MTQTRARRPSLTRLLRKTWPTLLVLSFSWYSQTLIFELVDRIGLWCRPWPFAEPCYEASRVSRILITTNVLIVSWFALAFFMWLGSPWRHKIHAKVRSFLDRLTFGLFSQSP